MPHTRFSVLLLTTLFPVDMVYIRGRPPNRKSQRPRYESAKQRLKITIPSVFLHNHDKTMFTLTLFSHPYQELCLSTRSLLSTTTRRCRETIASSRILNHATVKSPTINLFFFLNFPLPLPSIRFFLLWNLSSIDNTGAIDFSRLSLPLSTTCPTTTDSILKIHYRTRHTRQTLL